MEISWLREEEVGRCHPQVAVDLAGKQLIVVLGGINNERLNGRREVRAKGGKLDELRARSDDRRDAHSPSSPLAPVRAAIDSPHAEPRSAHRTKGCLPAEAAGGDVRRQQYGERPPGHP